MDKTSTLSELSDLTGIGICSGITRGGRGTTWSSPGARRRSSCSSSALRLKYACNRLASRSLAAGRRKAAAALPNRICAFDLLLPFEPCP